MGEKLEKSPKLWQPLWVAAPYFVVSLIIVVIAINAYSTPPSVQVDKQPPAPDHSSANIYWDMREPMKGYLEVEHDKATGSTYQKLATWISDAANSSLLELSYVSNIGETHIDPGFVQVAGNYSNYNNSRSIMIPLLERVLDHQSSERETASLDVIVTNTWFDMIESPYWEENHAKVKKLIQKLLTDSKNIENVGLIALELPWKNSKNESVKPKLLYILAVGSTQRIFDFCNSIVTSLQDRIELSVCVLRHYEYNQPLFAETGESSELSSKEELICDASFFPTNPAVQLMPARIEKNDRINLIPKKNALRNTPGLGPDDRNEDASANIRLGYHEPKANIVPSILRSMNLTGENNTIVKYHFVDMDENTYNFMNENGSTYCFVTLDSKQTCFIDENVKDENDNIITKHRTNGQFKVGKGFLKFELSLPKELFKSYCIRYKALVTINVMPTIPNEDMITLLKRYDAKMKWGEGDRKKDLWIWHADEHPELTFGVLDLFWIQDQSLAFAVNPDKIEPIQTISTFFHVTGGR